jgi:hypothetical protein
VTEKLTREELKKVKDIFSESWLVGIVTMSSVMEVLEDHTEPEPVVCPLCKKKMRLEQRELGWIAWCDNRECLFTSTPFRVSKDKLIQKLKHERTWRANTANERMVLQILRGSNPDLTEEGKLNLAQEIVRAYYGESSDTSDAGVNRGINAGSDGA